MRAYERLEWAKIIVKSKRECRNPTRIEPNPNQAEAGIKPNQAEAEIKPNPQEIQAKSSREPKRSQPKPKP